MRKWLRDWLGITALEAELRRAPAAATAEAATIAEWQLEREKHPPGSPKHTAYTNRLLSLGVNLGN